MLPRATENAVAGRMWPAGRCLPAPALNQSPFYMANEDIIWCMSSCDPAFFFLLEEHKFVVCQGCLPKIEFEGFTFLCADAPRAQKIADYFV